MIPYILHVSILVAAGFIFYQLLLKKLTFYALNRWILLGCLVVAFVLPVVTIPREWSWKAWEAHRPEAAAPVMSLSDAAQQVKVDSIVEQALRTSRMQKSEVKVKHAVTEKEREVKADVSPAGIVRVPVDQGPGLLTRIVSLLFYIYLAGVAVLAINLLRQMTLLLAQGYRGPVIRDGRYRIITTANVHGPCSFGNIIFIHPDRYDPETYQQILLHEKVHAGGWHTLDIVLAELGVIFQWFNPFSWLLRREVENNLEFLTDRHVLEQPGIERASYQLSLVKVAAPDLPLAITSNYNQSLLKRRIIMMHTQHSARHKAWKYFFLLPLFIFLAGILNRPSALAQQVQRSHKEKAPAMPAVPAKAPRPVVTTDIKVPVNADVSVSAAPDVDESPAMAPTVNVAPVVDVHVAASPSVQVVSVPPVPPVPAGSADTSSPSSRIDRMEGAWFITNYKQQDDKVSIELRDQQDDRHWNSSFSVPRSQLNLSSVGKVEFTLTREAGVMHFTGQFDGEQGFGHYKFQPDAGYLTYMRQQKVVEDDDELVSFFLLDIKKNYLDMLHANGFPNVSKGHLISMSALGIDEPYIKGVRSLGYMDISEGHLITFKALHIDKDYIDDVRKAGYDHLPADKLVTFKSLKIDGAYLRRLPAMSSPNDIITFKSLKIDSEYVAALKREGYSDIPSREIVSLRSLNVTPEYIHGFREIGYKEMPVHNLISLKSLGITPAFVKEFNDIGFKNIPLNQLSSLKAMGINAAYVNKMKEKGLVSDDLNKYIRLKSSWE